MTDIEFIEIVKTCKTMAYAAKQVKMAYSSFIRKAKELGCYKPNQGGAGTFKPKRTIEELNEFVNGIISGKYPHMQSYGIKCRLFEAGFLLDECCKCGWKEKPEGNKYTPCELDHINGDSSDHRLENLRILCPNCHSLTKTYRFRKR